MELVRIYEMPACKMVASQCGMWGDGKLERFDQWFSSLPKTLFPRDFLTFDHKKGGFIWYYTYDNGMNVPSEFDVVDFPSGLYAVITGIDGQDNQVEIETVQEFVRQNDLLEMDDTRPWLGNVITPQIIKETLGYNLMDYYVPIRIKKLK